MSARSPLPPRYPPASVWPAIMRADMTAAYLDYGDTNELARAVLRGEAPRPTGYHGTGRAREPIWSKAAIDNFLKPDSDPPSREDLASLV